MIISGPIFANKCTSFQSHRNHAKLKNILTFSKGLWCRRLCDEMWRPWYDLQSLVNTEITNDKRYKLKEWISVLVFALFCISNGWFRGRERGANLVLWLASWAGMIAYQFIFFCDFSLDLIIRHFRNVKITEANMRSASCLWDGFWGRTSQLLTNFFHVPSNSSRSLCESWLDIVFFSFIKLQMST